MLEGCCVDAGRSEGETCYGHILICVEPSLGLSQIYSFAGHCINCVVGGLTILQELGINTIRSYNVDPKLNHDECASIFNSVGIYMLLDVNSPLAGQSIDRSQPKNSYNLDYLKHIFAVVEAFKDYPNTLGFFSGNEIINDIRTAGPNPPYIRAVTRDLKQYIATQASRKIPVGYSAAQVQEVLKDSWAYLQCNNAEGDDEDMSRSDMFGLNSYDTSK